MHFVPRPLCSDVAFQTCSPPTLRVRASRPFLKSSNISFFLSFFLPFFFSTFLPNLLLARGEVYRPPYPPPGHQLEKPFRTQTSSETTFSDTNVCIDIFFGHVGHLLLTTQSSKSRSQKDPKWISKLWKYIKCIKYIK